MALLPIQILNPSIHPSFISLGQIGQVKRPGLSDAIFLNGVDENSYVSVAMSTDGGVSWNFGPFGNGQTLYRGSSLTAWDGVGYLTVSSYAWATSLNGVDWVWTIKSSFYPADPVTFPDFEAVVSVGNQFIGVDPYGSMYTFSNHGSSFTKSTMPVIGYKPWLIVSPSGVSAITKTYGVAALFNSGTWQSTANPVQITLQNDLYLEICQFNSEIILLDRFNGFQVCKTVNGLDWVQYPCTGLDEITATDIYVRHDGTQYVALLINDSLDLAPGTLIDVCQAVSKNGINWSIRSLVGAVTNLKHVIGTRIDGFIIGNDPGSIALLKLPPPIINKIYTLCPSAPDVALISTNNGSSWTEATEVINHDTSAICSNGTVFCVTPYDSNIVFTTADGNTVNYGTLPYSGNWNNIAWNGLVFLALLNNTNKCATSSNGITWEEHLLPEALTWKGLVYEAGVFCAFGYGIDGIGTEIPLVTTSSYGIAWAGFTQLSYSPPFYPPNAPSHTPTTTRNHQVHTLLGGGGYLVLLNPYGEGGSVNFSTDAGVTWGQTGNLWNYAGAAQMAVMNGVNIVYSGSYGFYPLLPTYDRDRCYFGNLKNYNIETGTDFIYAAYDVASDPIVATWGAISNAVFSVTYTGTYYLVITRLGLLRSTNGIKWKAIEDDGVALYPGNRFGNINAGQRILTASLNIADEALPVPRFWKDYVRSKEMDN